MLRNGKIDRKALPLPEFQRANDISLSDKEKKLRQLWSDVLDVGEEYIGRETDFFSLGATSLQAGQLSTGIAKELGSFVSVAMIFAHPTLAKLAKYLENLGQNTPLKRDNTVDFIPLSCAQKRLWVAHQSMRQHCPYGYNIHAVLTFQGDVNHPALQQALQTLTNRHAILRTRFIGLQEQRIEPFSVTLTQQSLKAKELDKAIVRHSQYDFGDLSQLPLWHATLFKKSDQNFLLSLVFHHSIIDGLSMQIFIRELAVSYNDAVVDQPSSLQPLPLQYADFAVWQQKALQSGEYDAAFAYWKQQLADASSIVELPATKIRPKQRSYQGANKVFYCSAEQLSQLTAFAERQGVTLFTVLFTAISVLLYRYSLQEDFIIGMTLGERSHLDLNSLVGFFVNVLPIRIRAEQQMPFVDLLKQLHSTLQEAYQHNAPLEEIIEELRLPHLPDCHPLFQVTVTLHNWGLLSNDFVGVKTQLRTNALQSSTADAAKFDLNFELELHPDGRLGVKIAYDTALFEIETIDEMAKQYTELLKHITPDIAIDAIPLMNSQEAAQRLEQWSQIGETYPRDKNIVHVFQEQVEQRPDAIAIIEQSIKLTYQQLNQRANQLAHYLLKHYDLSQPENIIAVALNGSIDFVITILAILKTGSAYLPLGLDLPVKRMAFMLEDAQCKVVISKIAALQKLNNLPCPVVCVDQVDLLQQSITNPLTTIMPNNLAYVIYTSGSTGKPKGVMVEHNSVVQLAKNTPYLEITPNDVFAQICNVTFDVSGFEIWGSLLSGASLVVYNKESFLDISLFKNKLLEGKITIMVLPTALFHRFLSIDMTVFSSVHSVLFIGEKLPSTDLLRGFFSHNFVQSLNIINVYGPTEDTVFSTYYPIKGKIDDYIPIGFSIQGHSAYILDAQKKPLPPYVLGELYLGGLGLARGYLNRPDLTRERFTAANTVSRLYRTGDLVYSLPNGDIVYVKRIDQQVKVLGHRIELMEIEKVILLQRNIANAIVLKDEEKELLIAYVTLNQEEEQSVIEERLQTTLIEVLPSYMIPVAFFVLEQLPLSPNGKLNRRYLPKLNFEKNKVMDPSNLFENQILRLWKSLLTYIKAISVDDDFFELGGNSLLAMRLVDLINRKIGKISYSDLFVKPTVREQAALLMIPEIIRERPLFDDNYLIKEAKLETAIESFKTYHCEKSSPIKAILLTGANGFLGAFLLRELLLNTEATVYCLIRAGDIQQAWQRLDNAFSRYQIKISLEKRARIALFLGDVAKPKLGLGNADYEVLADTIGSIYHCASAVNFIKPYGALKEANVIGTENVLHFSLFKKFKQVHYVSSVSVFSFAHYFDRDIQWLKEIPLDWESTSYSRALLRDIGYMQSKAVAEERVWQASKHGVPISIYRVGFILFHSETGVANLEQMWALVAMDALRMGYYPEFTDLKGEFVTVDFASQAIAEISQQSDCLGKIYHVVPSPESNFTTNRLFELLAMYRPIKPEPFIQWRERLLHFIQRGNSSALKLLLPLFTDPVHNNLSLLEAYQNSPHYEVANIRAALGEKYRIVSRIDPAIIPKYIAHMMTKSVVDLPVAA